MADRQAVAEMEQKVQAAEGKAKALEDQKRVADLQAQVEAAQDRAESLEEQQATAEMERKAKVLEEEKRVAGLQAQVEAAQELAAGLEDRVEKLTREKAVLTLQRQVQHVSAGSAEAAQQEVHAEYQKVIADLEARLAAAKGEAKSLADDVEVILQERAELASQSAKSVPIADLAALSSNIDTILVNSPASKAEAARQRAEQQLREQQELLDEVRGEAATAAAELAAKDKEVRHLSQALRGLMTVPKPKARGASWTWTTFLPILGMACSYLLFQNLDALAALVDRALADGGPSLYKPHLPAT